MSADETQRKPILVSEDVRKVYRSGAPPLPESWHDAQFAVNAKMPALVPCGWFMSCVGAVTGA